jgi:hypothetical protein
MTPSVRTVLLSGLLGVSVVFAAEPLAQHTRRSPNHRRASWDDLAQARMGTTLCAYTDPGISISLVAAQASILATHSWEYGTAAEALLELCQYPLLLMIFVIDLTRLSTRYAGTQRVWREAVSWGPDPGGSSGRCAQLAVCAQPHQRFNCPRHADRRRWYACSSQLS